MTWIYNEKWNRVEETNNDGKTKQIAYMSGNNTDSKRDGVKIIESVFMASTLRKIIAKNYNEISELNEKLEQSEHMVSTMNELVREQDKAISKMAEGHRLEDRDAHDYEKEISTLNKTIDEYKSRVNNYEGTIIEAYDVIDSYNFVVKNYEGMD